MLDRLQRGLRPAAFAYAVVKKFGDDTAGSLAALVTYYGFLSLFPLLLLLVTVLGIVAGGNGSVSHRIEHSALAEFPVIGSELARNIHALRRDSAVGLTVGLVGLVWGSQGSMQVGQRAMADVWNIPSAERPGFLPRLLRSLLLLATLGVFLLLSTAAAGFTSFAGTAPVIADAGAVVASLALNVVLFVVAFRILTPRVVPHRQLVPGAVAGGAVWTALQFGGTLLVDHELRGSNNVYGFFGIVLGLLAWIYLGAEATMYAAELNVVLARHLWPRSLVAPPLTAADREVYAALARQARQRAEVRVDVAFADPADAASGSGPPPE
jgi:YihY family inner membrane protein